MNAFIKDKREEKMPKIIENVREQLLNETKKQIAEKGYAKTTVRSVAEACGLGVGTVYNYFPSKDMLIATFMAEDWQHSLEHMKQCDFADAKNALQNIFEALTDFSKKHHKLFSDPDAAKVFATVFAERHKQLRHQLTELILPLCEKTSTQNKVFLSEYIAEALLTWTVAGKGFDEQFEIISKLLK